MLWLYLDSSFQKLTNTYLKQDAHHWCPSVANELWFLWQLTPLYQTRRANEQGTQVDDCWHHYKGRGDEDLRPCREQESNEMTNPCSCLQIHQFEQRTCAAVRVNNGCHWCSVYINVPPFIYISCVFVHISLAGSHTRLLCIFLYIVHTKCKLL